MLVKLPGESGVLQMFGVTNITTITLIIPFSHRGQVAGAGLGGAYTTPSVPLCLNDSHRYTRGSGAVGQESLC